VPDDGSASRLHSDVLDADGLLPTAAQSIENFKLSGKCAKQFCGEAAIHSRVRYHHGPTEPSHHRHGKTVRSGHLKSKGSLNLVCRSNALDQCKCCIKLHFRPAFWHIAMRNSLDKLVKGRFHELR
jgi:hypothetical protein